MPGVGAFGACLTALQAVRGGELIGRRLAGSRPVLGICVGMQVLFDGVDRTGRRDDDARAWRSGPAGSSGWRRPSSRTWGGARCTPPAGTRLLRGVEDERFYFVHSYAVRRWELETPAESPIAAPMVTWADHGGPFRRGGRERAALGDPVPPGEVRRRWRGPARELGPRAVTSDRFRA